MTATGHWQIDAFGIGAGERLIFAYFILKRDDVPSSTQLKIWGQRCNVRANDGRTRETNGKTRGGNLRRPFVGYVAVMISYSEKTYPRHQQTAHLVPPRVQRCNGDGLSRWVGSNLGSRGKGSGVVEEP